MAIPFKISIDLEKNQLLNAAIQVLSSDPGSPVAGQIYFNSVNSTLKFYTGSAWIELGRLNQLTAPTADVDLNNQKITNLATPTAATDAATKGYVDNLSLGIDAKPSCRVATTANITLSATQTVDGVALAVNDRVLVKNQTTSSQNGIYVVQSGAWTRATDQDTWSEVPGAFVFVEEGTTQPDTGWLCTSNSGGTLGTTAITWVQFSQAGVILAGTGLSKSGETISLANMAATSVKGNATGSTAAPTDIAASADNQVLRRSSGTLAFGTIDTAAIGSGTLATARMPALTGDVTSSASTVATTIASNVVTNTKLADMAQNTIKGRISSSTGDPEDLTAAQVRTILSAARSVAVAVPATTSSSAVVTHNLGTKDVIVQVYAVADDSTVFCDVVRTSTSAVTLTFGQDYPVSTYRAVISAAGV